MEGITLVIVMAVVVEALVEYGKSVVGAFGEGSVKTALTRVAAMVLGITLCFAARGDMFAAVALTDEEQSFMELFDSEPIGIDDLAARSGMAAGALTLMLMNLEMSGAIRPLPGKRYEKSI